MAETGEKSHGNARPSFSLPVLVIYILTLGIAGFTAFQMIEILELKQQLGYLQLQYNELSQPVEVVSA